MSLRPETEKRYRAATEKKYGVALSDAEWGRMVTRFVNKRRCRYAVHKNLANGNIYACICAVCESNDSEAHHASYAKPLGVVWLCRKHHASEHAFLRRATLQQVLAREDQMLTVARGAYGPVADWKMEEAMAGESFTEETDWGSEDDFLDTIIDYDAEAMAMADADSEDCLPTFVHKTEPDLGDE